MLEYNEIIPKKYIVFENEPYEVVGSHVARKQQRKPVNATKLRSLISGRIVEHVYHVSDKAEEADIEYRDVKYLFNNKGKWMFCKINDPAARFELSEEILGDGKKFLKTNSHIEAMVYEEKIIGVKLPIKVELLVTEAPPAVKGDTAKGGNKQITLETGAVINAPLFINPGDVVRINTDTGEYTERVGK